MERQKKEEEERQKKEKSEEMQKKEKSEEEEKVKELAERLESQTKLEDTRPSTTVTAAFAKDENTNILAPNSKTIEVSDSPKRIAAQKTNFSVRVRN